MKTKILKIFKNPFVQSVVVMITGTIGAQAVKMVSSPFITRIYGPEAFGIMGVFLSITQIIIPLAALTYPIAIVLPKTDYVAKKIIKLSLYISSFISLIALIILIIFNESIVKILNVEDIAPYLFLIPVIIILTTLMQVSEQWSIRKKQFGINAKATFYHAVIIETSKIGIGLISPVANVLLILTVLSNGLKAMLLAILGRRLTNINYKDDNQEELSIISIAKKHRDFPLLRAPQMLIDSLTKGLPVLLLTIFFSPSAAGFYTLCRSVLTLPSSLIGKAVGDVFYPRINEASINREKLSALIIKAVFSLSGIGIIPFGLLILFGPWIFGLIFGNEWIVAGEYARWLALSSFFRFINEPCIRAFPVLSAQSLHLVITIIQTIIRVIALWIGFYIFKDDKIAITLYGITSAFINLIIILLTIKISRSIER